MTRAYWSIILTPPLILAIAQDSCEDCSSDDDNPTETPAEVSPSIPDDSDGDGWTVEGGDCDDDNPDANPGAVEVCDLADNDCNGEVDEGFSRSVYYADADGDDHGDPDVRVSACMQPEGYVELGDDCEDTLATTYPGAEETCNDVDDDCDGEIDDDDVIDYDVYCPDVDGDFYGSTVGCVVVCKVEDVPSPPPQYVYQGGDTGVKEFDCNDLNPNVHPGAKEICGNKVDDDCDNWIDDCPDCPDLPQCL